MMKFIKERRVQKSISRALTNHVVCSEHLTKEELSKRTERTVNVGHVARKDTMSFVPGLIEDAVDPLPTLHVRR